LKATLRGGVIAASSEEEPITVIDFATVGNSIFTSVEAAIVELVIYG
jgi:hypothetical protein